MHSYYIKEKETFPYPYSEIESDLIIRNAKYLKN